ncbi:MAG: Omp28-related outer membrane protein [candidate division WOR-3 bacterium]
MRGRWQLVIFCLPLLFSFCSEAPEVQFVPSNRIVLVEFFTWQRCVYCPYCARTLESLAQEFHDSIAIIAYHRRVAGDTLSPEYVEGRRARYYESGGEPAVVFDGGEVVRTPGPEYNYETFRNYILGAKSILPKARLDLEAYLDSGNLTITVQALGVDSTPRETLALFVVITEDSIRAVLPGATDSVFNNVMRAILPVPEGKPIFLFSGDSLTTEIEFPTPPYWKPEHLRAIAFVQEPGTKRVLQTAKCPIIRR